MSRTVVHGIVKEIVKAATRLVGIDIVHEYSLDFICADVMDFSRNDNKHKKYDLLNGTSVKGKKGVYVFFDDNEVIYVGEAGYSKKGGENANLDQRIKQHITGNITVSPIMKYFYLNCEFENMYGSNLWDKKYDNEEPYKKARQKFKQDYFNSFLSLYSILIIPITPQVNTQTTQKEYELIPIMLERALITLLHPKINV